MATSTRNRLREVTVDEALKLVMVSDIRPAPDGELVAFVKSQPIKGERKRASSIWQVPAAGGKARQLTRGRGDGQPRWSPDGQTLAFTRTPEGGKSPQIFLLPLDGGEPEKLTDMEAIHPEALSFSPTGKRLGFLAPTPDDAKTKKRKEDGDDARLFVSDDKHKRFWSVALTSGKAKACSPDEFTISGYDWFPESKQVAVVASDGPRLDDMHFRSWLGILDLSSSEIERFDIALCLPQGVRVSPGGKSVAVIAGTPDAPQDKHILVVDAGERTVSRLTTGLPVSIAAFEWLPDSSGMLVMVEAGTRTSFRILDLAQPGTLRTVCESLPPAVDGFAISHDGHTVYAVAQSLDTPPELWRTDVEAAATQALTEVNSELTDLRIGRSTVERWQSTNDLDIDGILTLPPGRRTKPYPTILLVHGGPAGRFREDLSLLPRQILANAGYAVLAPNPRGSSGYGHEFMTANARGWGRGDLQDLLAGLDRLVEDGIADDTRLGIWGGSYGGYMTAWTVTQTNRFRAAICQCGISDLFSFHGQTDISPGFLEMYFGVAPYDDPDLYRAHSAMTHIRQVQTAVLFLHGEQDVRVPIAQSYEMYWGLRHVGVDTEFVIYPREGHGIEEMPHQRDLYRRAVEWFREYLG